MRRCLLLITALCLLTGCNQREEESPYQLYFTVGDDVFYGETVVAEPYELVEEGYLNVVDLMADLLDGPDDPQLINPFPTGTRLIWATWRSDGVLRLNLSEEYGGLTGIALTQADYCIVRTVSQIEGVNGVEILVANQENQFRHHQILTLEDVV